MTKGKDDVANTALKAVEPTLPTRHDAGAIMEQVIVKGDLKDLKPEERARYYLETCRSLGINPLVKPFEYITLNGKLTLYATRTATDQLRAANGVTIEIVERKPENDLYLVHARATMGRIGTDSFRADEAIGAVSIGGLKGDALANAYMKAETKAKRRVTLSICGLGFMDESELATVPGAVVVPVDMETGEIMETELQPEPPPRAELVRPDAEPKPERAPSLYPVTRDKLNKDLHWEAEQRGLSHEDLHAIVVGQGSKSVADLSVPQLEKFVKWVRSSTPQTIQRAIDAGRDPATLGAK